MRHRVLTLGPDNEPLWVRLSVHPFGTRSATMLIADDVALLTPSTLAGLTFVRATRGDVGQAATAYLGLSAPAT